FNCRDSACSTDIERSQNPRLGVIDQASAVHEGIDPDKIASVRVQGDRLLPVPQNGFIGCDQEPAVKVAHEQSLVGNRVEALAGSFGRAGVPLEPPEVLDLLRVQPGLDMREQAALDLQDRKSTRL